jgi:hypothetical protein
MVISSIFSWANRRTRTWKAFLPTWPTVCPPLSGTIGSPQDEFLYGRLDPQHGIGGEPEAPVGLEAFDRLHQADMAFRDQVGDRQTVAAI